MPNIVFYHPNIVGSSDGSRPGPYLTIPTGVDSISWGYNLNTAVYPTYGGEVVQILSCYVDDLEIIGTLSSYASQEQIYSYFAYYLQIATQGHTTGPNDDVTAGKSAYNQIPMTLTYPERGWTFDIIVTGLPGFRQARDLTAPQWRIQAHIVDNSQDLSDITQFTQHQVLDDFLKNDKDTFDIQGRIGFQAENPFSAPGSIFGDTFDPTYTREQWRQTEDRFNEVIGSYLDSNDLDALFEAGGARPTLTGTNGNNTTLSDDANRVEDGRKQAGG